MPLSLNCFDDGNIIDGKRMFILIKLMFMMIFMVNGSVAASKTEKNNELNNELFPIDFILFSAHDLKNNAESLNLEMKIFGYIGTKMIDFMILDIFMFKYAVINEWNKLLEKIENVRKIMFACKFYREVLKKTKSLLVGNAEIIKHINNYINILETIENVILRVKDSDEMMEDNYLLPRPYELIPMVHIAFNFFNDTLYKRYLRKKRKFSYVENCQNHEDENDTCFRIKFNCLSLKFLELLEIHDAFDILCQILDFFNKIGTIFDSSFASFIRAKNNIFAFKKLNLGSEFDKIFQSVIFISDLKKTRQSQDFENKFIRQMENLKIEYRIHGQIKHVNGKLKYIIISKVFPYVYRTQSRIYSVQCFILSSIIFYNKDIHNSEMAIEILKTVSVENNFDKFLKSFSKFIQKISGEKIKFKTTDTISTNKPEYLYKYKIRLLQTSFKINSIPEEYYGYFIKTAGVLTIACENINEDTGFNLVTDKLLYCINILINKYIFKTKNTKIEILKLVVI